MEKRESVENEQRQYLVQPGGGKGMLVQVAATVVVEISGGDCPVSDPIPGTHVGERKEFLRVLQKRGCVGWIVVSKGNRTRSHGACGIHD